MYDLDHDIFAITIRLQMSAHNTLSPLLFKLSVSTADANHFLHVFYKSSSDLINDADLADTLKYDYRR
jgi:hypothetical protein